MENVKFTFFSLGGITSFLIMCVLTGYFLFRKNKSTAAKFFLIYFASFPIGTGLFYAGFSHF